TAVAIENSTVSCSDIVKFYSTDPVYMVVTANPQTMPSRDVPASQPAEIIANIMDEGGNPSENQIVTFTILGYTNTTVFTTRPSFSSSTYLTVTSATTDANGTAIVNFYPGEFPVSGPYYNSTATGTANVIATWRGNSTPIILTFKNYPYLRIETSVNPQTMNVSSTFDVDIKLIGDGWRLQQKPIDVVMCTDRSGSMLQNQTDNIIHDRMVHAMNAGKIFNAQMSANDRVGLVSFGDNSATNGWAKLSGTSTNRYGSYQWAGVDSLTTDNAAYVGLYYPASPRNYGTTQFASIEQTLSFTRTTVNTSIGNMVPAGGTPMREGLYRSVKMLIDNPRSNAVAAVVLLTDGAWNTGGDPQGGSGATSFSGVGTGSVITWAKNNKIKIYAIALGSDPSQTELQAYADETGGKFYAAPTATQLAGIYQLIAGDLREMAGVNTQMNLNFQNVNVTFSNVTTSMPGQQVFDYNYTRGESTWVTSWNGTMNPLPDQVPKPSYPNVDPDLGTYTTYPYSFNQRNEWLSTSGLNFNAGNISVNQTWETKFRFRVNQTGIIEIFGPGSKIVFNNGESTIDMPRTYISVLQNMTNYGINSTILDISDLHTTATGVIKDFIPLEWQVKYDGNQTVTERVSYSNNDGHTWVLFDTNYVTKSTLTDYSSLDVRLLPPGEYWIRVDASAVDAPSDREMILEPIIVGTAGRAYIKLE
ncbi:MAG: VWA domain-containing protein, partial [Methanoregula sp.]|nr:VWA domain-containing protein [Methanoregula sp.]